MSAEHTHSWEDAVAWLREDPSQQEFVKNCYFDLPLEAAAERFHKSPEWLATRRFFPNVSGTALDVGAGNGIASYAMAKDGWTVTALEPDGSETVGVGGIQSLSDTAGLNIETSQEFGENLPFADDAFDLVYARQVLHHAFDLNQFCQELYRVTKPGGTLFTSRDHVISKAEDLDKFLQKHPLHHLYGGENAFTLAQYKGALEGAGFILQRSIGPFDSIINYAPLNGETLRSTILERLFPQFLHPVMQPILKNERIFDRLCSLLTRVDNRPGRLYSFVATKPQ